MIRTRIRAAAHVVSLLRRAGRLERTPPAGVWRAILDALRSARPRVGP